ncbi:MULTISPECIES: hypothetical protein [unclassified Streptomyces]
MPEQRPAAAAEPTGADDIATTAALAWTPCTQTHRRPAGSRSRVC